MHTIYNCLYPVIYIHTLHTISIVFISLSHAVHVINLFVSIAVISSSSRYKQMRHGVQSCVALYSRCLRGTRCQTPASSTVLPCVLNVYFSTLWICDVLCTVTFFHVTSYHHRFLPRHRFMTVSHMFPVPS